MKLRIKSARKYTIFLLLSMLIYLLAPYLHLSGVAKAVGDPLTNAEMRFYRLKINTAVNNTDAKLLIRFTPGDASSTENEIRVTFAGNGTLGAASYGVDSTASNITVSTSGLPTGCTAVPTIGASANGVSGSQVDFTSGDLTAGTTYCFFITGGITSPTSAGSVVNTIETLEGTNTVNESSQVAVNHITDDQVVISATVPATFTFTLSANSDSFTSNLSPSSIVSTSGVTATITTNASNGWTAYLRSANGGLDSATTGDTIDTQGTIDNTPTTLVSGSEYYQLDVDETTDNEANGSIDPEYNGTASQGGTFNSTDLEAIASGTSATSSYVMTLIARATISGTTKAANDYTDTWTVVASGNF